MKNGAKDSRTVTPRNLNVGDTVGFVNHDWKKDTKEYQSPLFWEYETVDAIIATKSGKRVSVTFSNGVTNPYSAGASGWDTPIEPSGEKYWKETEAIRGWK